MPGPNEPGYNVLHPPKTRVYQSWFFFWRALTFYNPQRYKRTIKYTRAIRRPHRR